MAYRPGPMDEVDTDMGEELDGEIDGELGDEGGELADEIDLSDILQTASDDVDGDDADSPEYGDQRTRNTGAKQQKPAGTSKEEKRFSQNDLERIMGERLREKDAQHAKDPIYSYGKRALEDRARRDGITINEAAQRLADEEITARAEAYAKDPKLMYADMLKGVIPQYGVQPTQPDKSAADDTNRFSPENVGTQLRSLQDEGLLPEGFTRESVDADFVLYAQKNGAEAALYRWEKQASKRAPKTSAEIAAELERRRKGPRPMKTSGGVTTTRKVDVRDLSKEAFAKLDEQVERTIRRGGEVRFRED